MATVKISGQRVKEGSQKHERLSAQKKQGDDLAKSEVGVPKKRTTSTGYMPRKERYISEPGGGRSLVKSAENNPVQPRNPVLNPKK